MFHGQGALDLRRHLHVPIFAPEAPGHASIATTKNVYGPHLPLQRPQPKTREHNDLRTAPDVLVLLCPGFVRPLRGR